MSAQPTSPQTAKKTYAATVAQPTSICTRGMTQRMAVNAAAASLRASQVPKRGRTYTVASIMAAATAVIASNSPRHKGSVKADGTPSPKAKVALPKQAETPKPCVASVMTIGTKTMEEQMQEIREMLELVLKDNQEKNKKLEELQKEVVGLGKRKVEEVNLTAEDDDTNKMIPVETSRNGGVACNEDQLQVLIANAVKSQLCGDSSGGARCAKPYSKRIDSLRMPHGYQPPKLQQFDGKGSPKQHVAHFIETCNNAGTEGDLLVKQFVRSLKGIAFDWYTDLEAESIDSWSQMEDEFFNRFYSTRRVVSMSELTNTKQWEEEPVVDYINRWRSLCLECKDRISETSAVEMCIDGMNWDLLYILKGIKPRNFQELATRAHDMEITVKGHGRNRISSSKAIIDEAMAISTNDDPAKISSKPKQEKRKEVTSKDFKRTKPTLKELQAKEYPFPDSDLSGMLDDLLEKCIINLPEAKRPDEVNRTNDPKYCRYHRLVSHSIENCVTLKELIMRLVKEGRIELDTDETIEANHASVTISCDSLCKPQEWYMQQVQFGTLEPTKVWISKPSIEAESKKLRCDYNPKRIETYRITKEAECMEDDEGWTLVTRRRSKKQVSPQPEPVRRKKNQVTKKRLRHAKGKKRLKRSLSSHILPIDPLKQIPPSPITLEDFFSEDYFDKVGVNATSGAYKIVDQEGLRVGPINGKFLKRYYS